MLYSVNWRKTSSKRLHTVNKNYKPAKFQNHGKNTRIKWFFESLQGVHSRSNCSLQFFWSHRGRCNHNQVWSAALRSGLLHCNHRNRPVSSSPAEIRSNLHAFQYGHMFQIGSTERYPHPRAYRFCCEASQQPLCRWNKDCQRRERRLECKNSRINRWSQESVTEGTLCTLLWRGIQERSTWNWQHLPLQSGKLQSEVHPLTCCGIPHNHQTTHRISKRCTSRLKSLGVLAFLQKKLWLSVQESTRNRRNLIFSLQF